jgi:hypothetical protein
MEMFDDNPGDETPLLWNRLCIALHILFCGRCAGEFRRLENAWKLLKTGYMPPSPDFADTIMARIYREETVKQENAAAFELQGGFSTRGWVIAGLTVLVSLATVFFGSDFIDIARGQGSSFLLPLGIIIGVIVTAYGSLFIGSHIEELSARFHLR